MIIQNNKLKMLDLSYKYDSFISVLCQPWKNTQMEGKMDTRPAIIAVIIEDNESVKEFNAILHEYAEYVIGRVSDIRIRMICAHRLQVECHKVTLFF